MIAVVPDVAVVPAKYVINRQLYFVLRIALMVFLLSMASRCLWTYSYPASMVF